MRILHVNIKDEGTGATQIARNLNQRLNEIKNIESKLAVGEKASDSAHIVQLPSIPFEPYFNFGLERVLSLEGLGSPSSFYLKYIYEAYDPDIIHLHVLHGKFINILNFELIPDNVPIVWTLHDMWPLTGNCVYSFDCERYTDSCGSCPQLDTPPELKIDTTAALLSLKNRIFSGKNITLVAPSQWMASKVSGSYLNEAPVHCIPNGIDTEFYSRTDQLAARREFGIDKESDVILFLGGKKVTENRKGYQTVLAALSQLDRELTLLVLGDGDIPQNQIPEPVTVVSPGFVPTAQLPFAYSAADMTVFPSLAEAFGLVATESMSCETPVVASSVGGLREQITNETGWLVDTEAPAEICSALQAGLNDPQLLKHKGKAGRQRVKANYSLDKHVSEHIDIYQRLQYHV